MGNGMNKVLPGLYVGNYRDSKDSAQLERFEITHILAIHDAARRLHSVMSGPAGLHYYTSSAPPSRAMSRVDLSAAVACSSTSGGGSTLSLSAIGRSAPVSSGQQLVAGSAPATPRDTPPVSPQHWFRRQQPQQPGVPQRPGTPQPMT
ncbi:uncharacterized protein LOC106642666 [Copidosoma floridanum]|uniref:uncharacterized protein LOC106642666 n=1 Tax=Copidosoma floridanum TaxID=29053 RepID=UPI000C6F6AFC|nr:uncharacterized protein LOC106642666 [Copidosoma floridanum]